MTSLSNGSDTWSGADLYAHGQQVWALLYGDAGMSQQSYSLYASGNQGKNWTEYLHNPQQGEVLHRVQTVRVKETDQPTRVVIPATWR